MIEINNVSKYFDGLKALDKINASIGESQVFGLIGTNGAGKSTLMRIICGVYRPDSGSISVDGEEVFENPVCKANLFYLSDNPFFYKNGTPEEMLRFYHTYYPAFDMEYFYKLSSALELDCKRKIHTFSKGMKKQLSILIGICAKTKYLLCDETFDGLDPVVRQTVKSLFVQEMENRGLTPIIASHNLRELEDICDHIGLLHHGGILFTKDLEEMKLGIHKLQCVFQQEEDFQKLAAVLKILKKEIHGSLFTLTIRGDCKQIETVVKELNPIFYEILPLSLEEIFISETEVQGYDFKNLIF